MTLSVHHFTIALAGLIAVFFVGHLFFVLVEAVSGHDYVFGLSPLFRLNAEQSVSTWYSSLTLALSSLILWAIYRAKSAGSDRYCRHWCALAIIFAFMSVDEPSSIHEKFSVLIRENATSLGLVSGQWTLVYVPLLVVFAFVYLPFLRSLWPQPGRAFVVAGAVFVMGAVVLELVGAYYATVAGAALAESWYNVIAGIEDLFEMLGVLLWMRALLEYVSREKIFLGVRLQT